MKRISFLFVLLAAFLFTAASVASAAPGSVLVNNWALGAGNAFGCPGNIDQGWDHSSTVSVSRCPKNPSPFGPGEPGAAFKNGPRSGPGRPGVETVSAQEFTLPPAPSHTFQLSALIVCVRCSYFRADLYGDGQHLGQLLERLPNQRPDYRYEGSGRNNWPGYTGDVLTTGHYDTFRIEIRTLFTASNSLGVKWTGIDLQVDQ